MGNKRTQYFDNGQLAMGNGEHWAVLELLPDLLLDEGIRVWIYIGSGSIKWKALFFISFTESARCAFSKTCQREASSCSENGSRFLLKVFVNTRGSCGMIESFDLRSLNLIFKMSTASIRILPWGSLRQNIAAATRIDFPIPVEYQKKDGWNDCSDTLGKNWSLPSMFKADTNFSS